MTDTTIQLLAKAFREAANACLPTTQQPLPQGLPEYLQNASAATVFQISPERDQREKAVWSVLSALASAFERAAAKE